MLARPSPVTSGQVRASPGKSGQVRASPGKVRAKSGQVRASPGKLQFWAYLDHICVGLRAYIGHHRSIFGLYSPCGTFRSFLENPARIGRISDTFTKCRPIWPTCAGLGRFGPIRLESGRLCHFGRCNATSSETIGIHMTSGVRTPIQGDLAEIMAGIDELAEFGPIRPVTAPIKAIWPRYWLVLTNWPALAQVDR